MIIDLNLAKVSVGSEVPISEDDDQNIVSELSKINSFPDFLLPVSKSSNYSSDLCLLILDHDMPNNDLIAPIGALCSRNFQNVKLRLDFVEIQ